MAQAPQGIDSSGKEIITQLRENGNRISELEDIKRNLPAGTSPEFIAQIDDEIRRNKETVDQLSTSIKNFSENCVARNVDISWMRENIAECKTYLKTEQYAYWAQLVQTDMSGPDPCGSSTLGTISKSLQKFFTFLKGIKKYYDKYVQGTLNAIQGLASKLRSIGDLIQGALRILIQRVRNWVIQKVKNLLSDALNSLLPNLAKTIKDGIIKQIIDVMFCKFTEIIKGLATLVTDFLFSLIGKFINAPFCAAEQFANSLVNNLANRIDKALGPILDQVNSIVGSIGQVAGSVFQVIDTILGFEKFLCSKGPECPELKDFKASWWAGPKPTQNDKFEKFLTGLQLGSGDNADLLNQFDKWLTGSAFGGALGKDVDPNVAAGLDCDTGAFKCGPPQVEIFGGGGVGAIGKAIVNTVGKVVGVDLIDKGYGYTSPPFVTFIDNCGNGNNAAAYAVLGDEEDTIYDPITGAPIGEYVENPTGGGPDYDSTFNNSTGSGCVYDFSVFHEFDNDNNVHLKTEISSSIDVEFKSKDAIDGNPAIPALDTNKHYSIKFKVPYDNDQYTINVYDKATIAAAIQQDGYVPGQSMEVAAIKNKTRFGFDIWFGRKYKTTIDKVAGTLKETKQKIVPAKVEFIQKDNKFYLDLRPHAGEVYFNLKYVIRDTKQGGRGFAAKSFKITGTSVEYSRKTSKGKVVTNGTYESTYVLPGGKLYGPILFGGGNKDSKVSLANPTEIRSLDPKSVRQVARNAKKIDAIDFNVYILDGKKIVNETKEIKETQNTAKTEEEFFGASYIRFFKIKTVGKRESCLPGAPLKEIVLTNPGGNYLPGPNNKDEFGNNLGGPEDEERDLKSSTRSYVGCLSEIQVIGTGIGYSPEDTVTITPDVPDLQVKIQLTEQGQVVNMLVVSEGCGVTDLPDIIINSETGTGAEFRPIIRFTSLEEFNRRPVSDREVIQVIDCV